MIFFSVIIPVYNVEKYLRQCVDSVLSQDYDNYEIILVDDGSPDLCPCICDEYASRFSCVNVIHKPNGGPSDARNAGLKIAHGDYITFIDSDDFWMSSTVLSEMSAFIEAQHCPDVIISDIVKYYDRGEKYLIPRVILDDSLNELDKQDMMAYLFYRCADLKVSHCQKFVRKECMLRVPFEKKLLSEDIEWSLRLYPVVQTVRVFSKPYFCYRQQREGSISNTASKRSFDSLMLIIGKYTDAIPSFDIPEEEKRIYLGYLAYQLSLAMAIVNNLGHGEKAEAIQRIANYGFLFNGALNHKTKKVALLVKILGIKATCRILAGFIAVRGKLKLG